MARARPKPSRKVCMVRKIGPWATQDYISFRCLCTDALRLEDPEFRRKIGLSPSSYHDVEAACKALKAHAVYQWLTKHVSHAMGGATDAAPFIMFRRLRVVVQGIAFSAASPAPAGRPDRRRKSLRAAIARLQQALGDGTLSLPNVAHEESLVELLAQAKERLAERRPRSVAYPGLHWLASELRELVGDDDEKLLLQVSGALDLGCDESTVRRYIQQARSVS